jgi:N-acetylglucosamine-6-sulfatase
VTDISLQWLKTGWDQTKPFFLMHHFKAPHDMFQNATRYESYLEDVTIPEPDNLYDQPAPGAGSLATRGPDDSLISRIGAGVTKRCNTWRLGQRLGVASDLDDPQFGRETYQRYLKRYLRCVKGVDDNVKRLLDHLEAVGQLENTVILYTGDQGFFLGEHDLMDKRWMYEEAFRMPFIVHYPRMVMAGSTNDWLVNNTDFAPTMLALAGAKTPSYMQGHSFLGALQGQEKPDHWRTSLYYRYWMHMAHNLGTPAHFGLRTTQYKLIFFYGANYEGTANTPVAWEFYDLKKDPAEMRNAYLTPEYQPIIVRMKAELKQVRADLNETDAEFPGIQKLIDAHW